MAGVLTEETNILGLPSLTGLTPLKARQQDQVLKYDFKGVGPLVIDKSGNFNRGILHGAKRKVVSVLPLKMAISCDGKDDYVHTPSNPTAEVPELTVVASIKADTLRGVRQIVGSYHEKRADWQLKFEDGHFSWDVQDSEGNWIRVNGSITPSESTEYHVKGVYTGEESRLYVNGEEDGSTPSRGNPVNSEATFIETGRNVNDIQYWDGLIKSVQIYLKGSQ